MILSVARNTPPSAYVAWPSFLVRTILNVVLVCNTMVTATPEAVEIASSVILIGQREIENRKEMCFPMIDAARQYPQSSLNFIITAYWVDEDKDKKPEFFCYDRKCKPEFFQKKLCDTGAWPAGAWDCEPATPDLIVKFRDYLASCFEYAVHRGFDIRGTRPTLYVRPEGSLSTSRFRVFKLCNMFRCSCWKM